MSEAVKAIAAEWKRQIISAGGDENVAQQAIALAGLNGLFDAHHMLEVSEAVNRAKTELLIDVKALLSDAGCTPGQQVMNALTAIAVRTGPPCLLPGVRKDRAYRSSHHMTESDGFKSERTKKDPLLWTLYYAMLEANGIHSDGYGLYPQFWRCAKVTADIARADGENGRAPKLDTQEEHSGPKD